MKNIRFSLSCLMIEYIKRYINLPRFYKTLRQQLSPPIVHQKGMKRFVIKKLRLL